MLSAPQLSKFATRLQESGEKDLAIKVARMHFEQYLYKLKPEDFFTKGDVEFFLTFKKAIRSSDPMFQYMLANTPKLDSQSDKVKGFATGLIESVITKEEIGPLAQVAHNSGNHPDWEKISRTISQKYGKDYAYRTIVNAKVAWYGKKEIWNIFLENLILQIEMAGDPANAGWLRLNGAAWNIFKYSDNEGQLKKALLWSEIAMKEHIKDSTIQGAPWGGILDTYANILYKLGRKEEAIKFYQEKILSGRVQQISLYENYVKMFRGQPTWPVNSN